MTALVALLVCMVLGLLIAVGKLSLDAMELTYRVEDLESDVRAHKAFGTRNDGNSMHALMNFVVKRQDALVANSNAKLDPLSLPTTSKTDDYGAN